jgi:ribonuclease VapC
LIVVDSSALVAMAMGEADRETFAAALEASTAAWLAPINYVETGVLLMQRGSFAARPDLDVWLLEAGVTVRDDVALSEVALSTYLRFGKGFHPARLNLADCFAYALAKQLDAPLLYKGDDFAKTDIRSAL